MENRFIRAEDVAQELNVSKPYAYKLIRQLNEELKAKGFYYDCRACKPPVFLQKALWSRKGEIKCQYLRMKIMVLGT